MAKFAAKRKRGKMSNSFIGFSQINSLNPKKRIRQTPSTSKFKGLNSSQLRKLQKEN